mgnify:CR=1 FL=1
MYIMTLKMKFIQDPRLEFFEKKSSRFIIVIIYIYNLFNRAQFVSYFVSDFVSDFSNTEKCQIADL